MDLLTQGLLGSALAQSGAKKQQLKTATWVGFLAGMLADADALIQSSSDPLLYVEYHRHFSHSIFFVPIGALIAALILWPLVKQKLVFKELYLYTFLGYSLSGVLDACTSYGTHIFWPLINERIAWNFISIIDPIFSLILIAAILFSLQRKNIKYARTGLILAVAYMSIGMVQKNRAEDVMFELAESRQHEIQRYVVKPTLGNLILWRSVYQANDQLYVDGIRVGLSDHKVIQGKSVALFKLDDETKEQLKDTVLYQDIIRFQKFSDGYIGISPNYENILSDVRYSNDLFGVNPLWGIELNMDKPNEHARFNFYRSFSKEDRQKFLELLF